jgi:hypothetical protein
MHRRRLARLHQGAVQDSAKVIDRKRSIYLLAVDKHGRGSFHAQIFAFMDGSFDPVVLLRFDTGLEFGRVQIVFLSLRHGDAIEGGKLAS